MSKVIYLLILLIFSDAAVACSEKKAFDIGMRAIAEKLPDVKYESTDFTIKDRSTFWVVLRKQIVYKENPKEYPRVFVGKDDCLVEKVIWSK